MSQKSRPERLAICAAALLALAGGCRQDMHDQNKLEPGEASPFFGDGRGARHPVEGTVARGRLRDDRHLHEGKTSPLGAPDELADTFPMPVTRELVQRGQERYNIFCAPCHARTGDGDGMVVRRGFQKPQTFHREELRTAKVGHVFEVVSKGLGVMPGYAAQINAPDRWAIVAYVRALQLSRSARIDDVPEPQRSELLRGKSASVEGRHDGAATGPKPALAPGGSP
jgi:mono/diheme cytochrome c family protein